MKPLGVSQLAVAAALGVTAAVLAAAASAGGLGDVASVAKHVARTVERAGDSNPSKVTKASNAGSDQYQPGYGFGDPNHNHEGPPGLDKKETEKEAAKRTPDGVVVSTTLNLSEQAVLTVSVVDADGDRLPIAQDDSSIGGLQLAGGLTKSVRYVVLVPRVLDLSLAVVIGSDYEPGKYRIRISAVDVDGNKSSTTSAVRLTASLPVTGTAGSDVIRTGAGDDAIESGKGADRIFAGSGDNRIVPGPGRDVVKAGGGKDVVDSRDGERDLVNGGPGRDTCTADGIDILISCELVRIR